MASIDSSDLMASSDSTEVPPSSLRETPTTINSTKTKSKCSIRHLLSDFKAKFCVSKPNSLENHHQEVASSSAPTHKNDHHGGALSLSSKMIRNDLLLVDSVFSEAKKYMDHLNVKIELANEKFEKLETLGSSQRDFDELRKAVAKLKFQIPSQGREDKEELPREEGVGNEIFDELIEEGFIEPINPNCSLVPDNCRMSLSVHSSLYKDAVVNGFTSQNSLDLDLEFDCVSHLGGHSCLVNVGESIINYGPEIFENMKDTQSLHLGR
ncbi:hypothetical protein Vadar_030075 [Vaccinium darrowii]|uniref:Uncharacterized protein n=1 Tax=Vaccinium darrowii TaxID=229202 RepID=A0ACB7Y2M3_9ERIC|nr:hypothetical protein Vadar_030075 [Vaccinium darrowii]